MMRILLDESMPRIFAAQHGAGTKNGKLLKLAASSFDVMITADRNIQYQQNPQTLPLAVVVLATPDGLLPSFQKLAPKLLAALATLQQRTLIELKL
ncbi:hypothetical protein ACEN9F_19070 [Duganella sp. CT11-25]|uniref:hypothetical protein n=1 Tax=unclassified Duganella TaxID=2636909 RepID=UPI0039B03E51